MELKWGPVPVSNGGANRPNRPRTVPMFEIAIPTLLLDVAAVFSGRHGAVTDRAEQAGCSRQTVYDHAQAVDDRLAERDRLRTDVRAELAAVRAETADQTVVTTEGIRRFAIARQALEVSRRPAEALLGTLGRWTAAAGKRAGEVLTELDPLGPPGVQTVGVDEIFFGGSRLWWRWSRPA